ncbi:hypothetical protein BGY98DRAFT_1101856 [Russula aff. rugulosa BPL654]|nr:hypothetical protein BGY98DRAFT_1101856 [Russula aff. rugulosa BPL654]
MSSVIASRHLLPRGTFLKTYASPALALSLRVLPRLAKLVAYILIILNLRSLPFAWHIHLFWPVIKIRCRAWCARIRTLSLSSAVREAAARKFLDDLCLSILDSVRMKSALMLFPYYVRTGGWIALAGTHFHFIREIPILARYEVRSQIVGWDQKWLYIVHRFVTHRKSTSTRSQVSKDEQQQQSSAAAGTSTSNANATNINTPNPNLLSPYSTLNLNPNSAATSASPIPMIHTPSTPLTNLSPSPSSTNLQAMGFRSGAASITTTGRSASPATIAAAAIAPEPDGATLHCVSVNVVVFKHGRITVPPALALAGEGLGATPAQGMEARARALAFGLNGMRELYLGGWRGVPEGDERWWDVAMKGLEGRIDKRVGKVRGVREGLEGALQVRMLLQDYSILL